MHISSGYESLHPEKVSKEGGMNYPLKVPVYHVMTSRLIQYPDEVSMGRLNDWGLHSYHLDELIPYT